MANSDIRPGGYKFLDPEDGGEKKKKITGHAVGPYRVLENAERTFVIQRWEKVEHVNSDRVTRVPPAPNMPPRGPYQAISDEVTAKTRERDAWLFEKILGDRFSPEGPCNFIFSGMAHTSLHENLVSIYPKKPLQNISLL